jgi:hypothetical protein
VARTRVIAATQSAGADAVLLKGPQNTLSTRTEPLKLAI